MPFLLEVIKIIFFQPLSKNDRRKMIDYYNPKKDALVNLKST